MDTTMILNALENTVAEVGIHESVVDMIDQDTTQAEYI